jgi:hypothetical protein
MTAGHDSVVVAPSPAPAQPLSYLYATWDPGVIDDGDPGYYDHDAQIWVSPQGVTRGVPTKTKTSGCPGDCVTDDACF